MRAFAEDPDAMQSLVEARVQCNQALADDVTIQCGQLGAGKWEVGALGLINGLLGVRSNGCGYVAAVYNTTETKLIGFKVLGGEEWLRGCDE
jgi:hypothetical protein